MATKILELPIENESIYVEVTDLRYPLKDISIDNKIERLTQGFDRIKATVRSCARLVVAATKEFGDDHAPDEISLEIGLKLDVTHSVIITQATEEANFRVAMTWKRKVVK